MLSSQGGSPPGEPTTSGWEVFRKQRERPNPEFDRFEALTTKLLGVPGDELAALDEPRAERSPSVRGKGRR